VDIGPDQVICPGTVASFDASTAGATYLWSDGSTGPSLTTGQPGTHSVAVTVDGCSASDAALLSHYSLHTVDLGPDRSFCAGASLALGVDVPGASHLWSTGATTDSITVADAGIYWLDVTLNGCVARDSIAPTAAPLPVVSLGNDTAICAGSTLVLDPAVPGATYLWQDGSTASTFPVTTAGVYQVEAQLNGCVAQDAIQVQVTPLPVVDIGPDQVICPGTVASFDASTAGATYLWSDGSTGASLTTGQSGTHSVVVTVDGCSASDAALLSHYSLHTVDLGPDRSFCAGASLAVGVDVPGASHLWSTGATTDSITVAGAGIYWVDVTLNGCVVRDSIALTEVPLPTVSLGPDRIVCPGGTAALDASIPGATYLWNNGAITPTLAAAAGTWSVSVTVNGCTDSDSVLITETAPPAVDLGPDTLLCPGESLPLDAHVSGATYLWSTGATGASILITTPLTASVTVTDAQGCSAADTITVSFATPGTLSLGPDTSFCAGSPHTLNATTPGASAYLWSDGSTQATLTTGDAGTYWVSVTQGACTIGDTVVLQSSTPPSISLGNDTTLCPGETLHLHVPSGGLQLEWQDGSQSEDFLVTEAGQYGVIATNAAGCTDTATIAVSFLGMDAFELGQDTLLCTGSTLLLNAGLPGGTTQWSGASTAQTGTLTVSEAGLYIATTAVAGCAFTDSITISFSPPPPLDLGTALHICAGASVELTAEGASVLWDDGSTAPVRTITQGGLYWVELTEGGCTASDTVLVTEIALPVLALGADTGLCATDLLPLDITIPGGTYLWNDGSTDPVRSLAPGTWSVAVTVNGCSAHDTLQILALPAPVLALPTDTTLCAGDSWILDLAQPNASYQWSTGSTSSSLVVNAAGLYSVTVNREGCMAFAEVNVAVVDIDQFTLGPDTVLCPGASLLLDIGVPGALVLWEDGSSDPQRTIQAAGTYGASVSVGSCTAQSSVHVGYTALIQPSLGPDQQLCRGDTVLLVIDAGIAQPTWNTGTTGPELTVTSTGTYVVELLLDGCLASDTILLTFSEVVDHLDLGPDQALCPETPVLLDALLPGGSYAWSTGSHQPTLTVTQPGSYWVTVTGPCIQATDTVLVVEGACRPLVHIPNAFTPDGDGINDLFAPQVWEPVRNWSFSVFNRWGAMIYSSTDPTDGWDGTFGGEEAPVGVYVWDLYYDAVSGSGVVQERMRGTVTLVR